MAAETQIDPVTLEERCKKRSNFKIGQVGADVSVEAKEIAGIVPQGQHLNKHTQFLDRDSAKRSVPILRAHIFQRNRKPERISQRCESFESDPVSGEQFDQFSAWLETVLTKGTSIG